MTGMTAKEYLSQARGAEQRIEALRERIIRYEDMATAGTTHYRKGPRSTRRAKGVGDYACELADLAGELRERLNGYARLVSEIERAIDDVPDIRYRDLLRYRYLNGMTWERIAVEMGYTWEYVRRLHGYALQCVVVPVEKRYTKSTWNVL